MIVAKGIHLHSESGCMYQRDHCKDEVYMEPHPTAPNGINAVSLTASTAFFPLTTDAILRFDYRHGRNYVDTQALFYLTL